MLMRIVKYLLGSWPLLTLYAISVLYTRESTGYYHQLLHIAVLPWLCFCFFLLDVSISVVSFFLAVLAPQCTQLEKPRLSLKGKGGRLESRKGAIRNATAESSVNVASFAG